MKCHILERLAPLKESSRSQQKKFTSRMSRIGLVIALCLTESALAAAQNPPSALPSPDAQKCAALTALNLEAAPGGPAIITSARLVEVPASGLPPPFFHPSRYASSAGAQVAGKVRQYCDVTGYVAPQNKFDLKLPLPGDWNQKFFFYACGGFCGTVVADACNLGLARGYASVTGNGGHDSALGFDGVWAANAPELQEDFGWRSTHVVTLIAKTIGTHYYGKPIKYCYMVGNSKGGQAVLMEAQRFPEDFDGLMPSAPVYDYTGRNTYAAAWWAQAVNDGHGGSVLNDEAAQAVHKSVLRAMATEDVAHRLIGRPMHGESLQTAHPKHRRPPWQEDNRDTVRASSFPSMRANLNAGMMDLSAPTPATIVSCLTVLFQISLRNISLSHREHGLKEVHSLSST